MDLDQSGSGTGPVGGVVRRFVISRWSKCGGTRMPAC